jgi:hypothetical protein
MVDKGWAVELPWEFWLTVWFLLPPPFGNDLDDAFDGRG